jgi:hypothetical protein
MMNHPTTRSSWCWTAGLGLFLLCFSFLGVKSADKRASSPGDPQNDYAATVRPLLQQYCLSCHSTKVKKGSLDLERFASLDQVRKDLKPWQGMIEMLEAGEMPPKNKAQPTAEERRQLIGWIRGFLDAEARARAGDPGHVPLRRLSNAEYDCTIRDLCGVDLRPAREFPADGAAGEGFTNAAEALSDISPALLTKYLNAAKDVSEHVVLLPDGFRFSLSKTRRDWTDESTAQLRRFFATFTLDGRLPFQPYVLATVRHRDALVAGKLTLEDVAGKEKLNPKYLSILWQTLTGKGPSHPLDLIRARWRQAAEKDVPVLVAEITAWQAALWTFVPIGSYRYGNTVRQVANDPPPANAHSMKLAIKPAPGQNDVTLYLVARDLAPDAQTSKEGLVLWQRPRLETPGKPTLLLRDYADFGARYEIEYPALFADTARYLAAAVEAANDKQLSVDDLAKKHNLDSAFLKRWISVVAVEPLTTDRSKENGRAIPVVALDLLTEKAPKSERPAINGWRRQGTDLPILITNSSDKTEHVPGRMSPHKVAVHPTPQEFVAVFWKSPVEGEVRVGAHIAHAHPACGNGIAWWVEHRHGDRAVALADGTCDLGQEANVAPRMLKVARGDIVLLGIDARDGNHSCDLTEIALTISATGKPNRVWDLAADVADNVLDGNPHADKLGNKDVWSFVKGPAKPSGFFTGSSAFIPAASLLGQWREAAANPARQAEAGKLAEQVKSLLTGGRPAQEKHPNRILYDNLVAPESPLFQGVDLARLAKAKPDTWRYGLKKDRFGQHPDGKQVEEASLVTPANEVVEIKLPAVLFRDREFVVEGKLDGTSDRLMQFQVLTAPPTPGARWDGKSPVVTALNSPAYKRLIQGHDEFRRCFPQFICFSQVIPTDEVVSLKMFHREDEPLIRLLLDDQQKRRLDRLWEVHRFISRQAVAENEYLPQFIGYVTQDQPKELLNYFESQRPVFRKRADDFLKDEAAAVPKQLEALLDFASRAYRRPLQEKEKTELLELYQQLRKKDVAHDEAFRGVLARVLVAPAFLFRIEQAPPGKQPGPINDWELATRLSYFLWSSGPDDELRRLAAAGQLHEPRVLAEQTRRMIQDGRLRSLAIEFGTQWLHVRGFDEMKEKNEKLFPTFDATLRKAINEESILFFQDLFQSDRSVTQILDADHTFLNATLAKHYGIPGIDGDQWRKVDGIKKYGRGGILGLASVQAKESGASRTSPVLRGNWVVETLLGEKLPRPPPNVPRLPEEEKGNDGLTMRQLVEKHARVAECAVCHVRIDPFGFALERYDPIGRWRDKDLGGLAVDARAKLKDGTEFEGIDGLRNYLLTKKKDVIVRLFCRKLLGYALGRAVTLSDQALLDEMVAELQKNEGRLSAAVLAIVRSPQFRMIRGSDRAADE